MDQLLRCHLRDQFLRRNIPDQFLRRHADEQSESIAMSSPKRRTLRFGSPGQSIGLFSDDDMRDRNVNRPSGCEWCLNGERPVNGLCPACVFQFRRMLQSSRWIRYRLAYLSEHPYCEQCLKMNVRHIAEDIDHVRPWRFFPDLFWQPENHMALNHVCHSRKTNEEKELRKRD